MATPWRLQHPEGVHPAPGAPTSWWAVSPAGPCRPWVHKSGAFCPSDGDYLHVVVVSWSSPYVFLQEIWVLCQSGCVCEHFCCCAAVWLQLCNEIIEPWFLVICVLANVFEVEALIFYYVATTILLVFWWFLVSVGWFRGSSASTD